MQPARILEMLGVAERAAIASAEWIGKGDKMAADEAATTAMREALNSIAFSGRVVIGEGERDEAPMLYIGEEVGLDGEEVDIAVDPLEGTDLCACGKPNALTAIAVAPRGTLLFAPDTYLEKIAAGPAAAGAVYVDKSPAENVAAVAEALGKPVGEVNVCILDRDRHAGLVQAVRDAGARVRLIGDGDVFGAIAAAVPGTGIDLYLGAGGAPEGVLSAVGLKAIGGVFMGRLRFDLDKDGEEKRCRAEQTADVDLDGVLTMDMLVRTGDAAFIACGVTDGEMVSGVSKAHGCVTTESLVMNAAERTVRFVKTCRCGENGSVRFG